MIFKFLSYQSKPFILLNQPFYQLIQMQKKSQSPSLKQQKRRQIITELRQNDALIKIAEKMAHLLAQSPDPERFTFTREEIDCGIAVMNQTAFEEVVEERATQNLCSNLYCQNEASKPKPTKFFNKKDQSHLFCPNPDCQLEFNKTNQQLQDQESALFENHSLLDLAANCLQRYCDSLSEADFVENLEKTNLSKTIKTFQKVMEKVRVQIMETQDVEVSTNKPASEQKQQVWTIDTTVHQKEEPKQDQGEENQPKKKQVSFQDDKPIGSKQNPLQFDIVDKDEDSKQSEESDDNVFEFEDISQELAYFQKQEMSTFQKINMFFLKISTQALSNFLNGVDDRYQPPELSTNHRYFCDQIELLGEGKNDADLEILTQILVRCQVDDEVPVFKEEEWSSINKILNYLTQELVNKKYPEAKVEVINVSEEEKILSQFLK